MHRIPSIDRIRELQEEIAALVKLNAIYKADSRRSELTLKANVCRGLRLMEIREELKAMKQPASSASPAFLNRHMNRFKCNKPT